ncbi:MAG: hypothetical protein ABIE03_02760 [Patescibacteria group bacterium]|nr:hypothetical protein [Patescibacteria group bacterium]
MDKIKKIESDIKAVKIQGATNVALAALEGIRIYVHSKKGLSGDKLYKEAIKIGDRLSKARENEPLARNAIKYMLDQLSEKKGTDVDKRILEICDEYESLIQDGKVAIVDYGTGVLKDFDVVLNHCHSSTALSILKNIAKYRKILNKNFKVVATETRPLYQGRKSAQELLEFGVDTYLIVDSACASFITDNRYIPVDAIVVGCDELLGDGAIINKVGTFSIALAAQKGVDSFYVATTLLKLDQRKSADSVNIEQRNPAEVWKDAPQGLEIINPAFEIVRSEYIKGYITEAGVLKPEDLISASKNIYPWLVK